MKQADYDTLLAEEISQFYADPYGFVKFAFPWGEPDGPLAAYDGPDTWQETLLKRLGEEIKQRAFDGVKAVQPILMSVASGHGVGKGHSLPTPAYKLIMQSSNAKSEWIMQNVAWGDLKPGDYVYGADGNPTEIVATRHYKRPHYRVTFDDGASTVVSGEHEWQVRGRQERRKGLDSWRVLETEEILRLGVLRKNGSTMAKQWEIPVQKPIQFPEKAVFDPYTVGVWLGDGASSSGQISSTRHELWERIGIAPKQDTLRYKKDGTMTATVPGLIKALKKFGMAPTTCDNKFVARVYKYNSERVRREILSGLLDTDGEVNASGSICYSSTSKRLVEDVIWLARSLGAKAQMQDAVKQTFYTRKDGTRSAPCKPCYRCTIAFGDGWNPFTHTYKRERLGENRVYQDRYTKRWIESIEPVGEMEGMCIEVAANDHLYLANDFIVTHNSSLTSWLILFVLSTRPNAKIIVTAGTQNQLSDKTWAELAKWHKMAINGHWFTYYNSRGNLALFRNDRREAWFATGQASTKENADSFAGLHNANSTACMIFDEASAVASEIYEVANGAMTDGEPMMFLFGNPTRSTGYFADTFGRLRHRWINWQVDSRTAKMTNKELINQWVEDYGEDSDFVRVRVRGQFPRVGDSQFISTEVVEQAMERHVEPVETDPIVIGVDVARFGDDQSVFVVVRGRKLLTIRAYRELDLMELSARVVELIKEFSPHAVFVDGAGVGAGVVDRLHQLQYKVIEVQAGSKAEDPEKFCNKRAEMWWRMRDWLKTADIPRDALALKYDLTGIEYAYDAKMRIQLEKKSDMKKRGLASPDYADALAMAFAEPVNPVSRPRRYDWQKKHKKELNWRVL